MKAAELFVESISNPFKAQEAAREMALRSDLAPDEIKILRFVLQPWWDTERDAQALCRYLCALGAVEKQGSVAHRLAVKIAVLGARTIISKVREQDRAETNQILDTLDMWARGETSEAGLQALRDRAWALWNAADEAYSDDNDDAAAVHAASAVSSAADAATSNTSEFAAQNAFLDIAHAAASKYPDTPEWIEVRDRYLAHLADMIRTEIPLCPMRFP